ncbi:MAG: alpha/beta hydrolase [Planctomycetales bacterium]|nr:alpha/beta hydrolase [Planctomycetales bacterium]
MPEEVFAAEELAYKQQENIVFSEVHGFGLLMDVFTPTGTSNGLAIVDVACGAFHSDRGKINDHKKAGMFDTFCGKGYTVFAVRPGSISKFSAPEMIANLNQGVSWVIEHAEKYQIDADRMGLMGASAGGYLACLDAVTAEAGSPAAKFKAVGVFFPPTDLLNYGPVQLKVRTDPFLGKTVRRLLFPEGFGDLDDKALDERVAKFSPARRVTSSAPPFLFIHGDADPLVPLQQSEVMVEALKAANVSAELIVKPGGAHPWPTIAEEVAIMADWFDKTLDAEIGGGQ